ncbi:response regulator transcription factor [Nostocoides sp.]|jgi:DNA-binding NarL/FixJ family response regulator|uniref:response regulator transcription factor n=1 Tax=Nostocoides sp. TaxID=1917966 RepID=UPI002B686098|nr:response regulator transcription factor [Tetrasphaera sp.]
MSAPIRVVVVDDDPMVRTGLRLILGGNSGIEIVAEAVDGQDAVQVVTRTRPDVVLMDIRMPRRDGLSATVELLALSDPPRILVLTTFDTDELVLKALRAGAAGFLLKDTPPAQLVQAVRSVAAGQPSLSPSVTAQLIAALAHPETIEAESSRVQAQARLADLTERELEVAQAVGRGHSNSEIAAELFMSVATVKAHVGRLFTKLGVDNRVQIAILVNDADK